MKRLQGYLIDRETGAGISGKTVSFENLAGSAITTATTYAQAVDSVTDGDGKFDAWFELSPGPVNIQVDVSASEIKVRKHDEMAQFGAVWSSDIQRMGRSFPNGVIDGYLNELAVTTPSGHTIRIDTGAAIINGHVFSIENGVLNVNGSANSNPAVNPRVDLVTLRQHHDTAAGQDSGRQEVVIVEGSVSNVAPANPTNANWTSLPLATVSTAFNASTKTVVADLRVIPNSPEYRAALVDTVQAGTLETITSTPTAFDTLEITGLDPARVYDGTLFYWTLVEATDQFEIAGAGNIRVTLDAQSYLPLAMSSRSFGRFYFRRPQDSTPDTYTYNFPASFSVPIVGFTGSATLTIPIKLHGGTVGGTMHSRERTGYLMISPRR